jgi:integrase
LLVFLGLRIGEALAIRVRDVDLLEGVLHVRHNWRRDRTLNDTKTEAGVRDVPLSPGMVDLFVSIIPAEAEPDDFVFHTKYNPRKPISYWNFRKARFHPGPRRSRTRRQGDHHSRTALRSRLHLRLFRADPGRDCGRYGPG